MLDRRHFLAMVASTATLLAAKPSRAASLSDWIADIRIAFLFLSAGIPTHSYSVPSGSMLPTIRAGDIVLADLRAAGKPPAPGDMVVVRMATGNILTIKRVVGLSGDRIQVKEGILRINGQAVQRQTMDSYTATSGERLSQYIETLPNGFQHRIVERSDVGMLDNTDIYVVPPDHCFTLGDNRDNALDSRVPGSNGEPAPVGYVPPERLVGRIIYRLRPNAAWLVPRETVPGLSPATGSIKL